MYQIYQTLPSSKSQKEARQSLKILYEAIPDTEGCMDNISKDGGCGAWCCLTPETIIYTAFGPIPIKDVFVGMSVMTKGGWRRVIKVASKQVDKPVVRVSTAYGREIVLTNDHLVYSEFVERPDRYKQTNPVFVDAASLQPKKTRSGGHYIIFPKSSWAHDTAKSVVVLDVMEYHPFAYSTIERDEEIVYQTKRRKGVGIPRHILFDEKWARILGLFLAEGSFDDSQLNFHFSEDEIHLHDDIKSFAASLGLRCSWRTTHGKSFTMRIFSRVLNSLFRELCGDGCDNKRLHPRLLDLIGTSKRLTQAFHDGLYAGDGGHKSAERGIYSYTTTSPILASQMTFVNYLLGRFVGVYNSHPVMKKPYWTITDDQSGKYKDYIETENDWRVPVRSVEIVDYAGLVFDIEIEQEHSFLTEAGEVHNCQLQTPQVFFSEFLNTWNIIKNSWTKVQLNELLLRCVENYLNGGPTKGCVFWNRETKMCGQHNTRPYNCRTYGQIPDVEFKPRYEKLKVLYPESDIREQCSLVKTQGERPTTEQMNEWFQELMVIEHQMGISPKVIHGEVGGTYRTYHDHILLMLASGEMILQMTEVRTGSEANKTKYLNDLRKALEDAGKL